MREHKDTPLAEKSRPMDYDDLIGQEAIWAPGRPLRKIVENDGYTSLILWGPPGCGKTSLANIIGKKCGREMVWMSAVEHGVKDIRSEINRSVIRKNHGDSSLLIFMDEIHRLNKAQQDVLLPALESGSIKFIGATTENPSFEVNKAILSRSLIFSLNKIPLYKLVDILKAALEKWDIAEKPNFDKKALEAIARSCDGDARSSINLLEAIVKSMGHLENIKFDDIADFIPDIIQKYDKNADQHYDVISAFIKSIRASNPDGAVYYLARMLDAGEDPMFIARRVLIAASEDIGNANPTALMIANNAMDAVHKLGMPEARIVLSQAVTYLAASPKSNRAYLAINEALSDVKRTGSLEVPMHLRNAPTKLMKQFGYSKGYVYAHDNPKKAAKMEYIPKPLQNKTYYHPSDIGVERQLKENLRKLKEMGE